MATVVNKPDDELIGIAQENLREQREGQKKFQRAQYIRQGLREAGYSDELADLADFMRGDRDRLKLELSEPGGMQAAEWFVKMLAEQQANIRFERGLDNGEAESSRVKPEGMRIV